MIQIKQVFRLMCKDLKELLIISKKLTITYNSRELAK